jgi:hypothetical protein
VRWMVLRELVDGSVDGFDSAFRARRLGRDVGVSSSAVPVATIGEKSEKFEEKNFSFAALTQALVLGPKLR